MILRKNLVEITSNYKVDESPKIEIKFLNKISSELNFNLIDSDYIGNIYLDDAEWFELVEKVNEMLKERENENRE